MQDLIDTEKKLDSKEKKEWRSDEYNFLRREATQNSKLSGLSANEVTWKSETSVGHYNSKAGYIDSSPLVFNDRGVKMNAEYYQENSLEEVPMPWTGKYLRRKPWAFQQNSALSYPARVNQECSAIPCFVSKY